MVFSRNIKTALTRKGKNHPPYFQPLPAMESKAKAGSPR